MSRSARQRSGFRTPSLLTTLSARPSPAATTAERWTQHLLWREVPTFVGVLAALLVAIFL